MGVAPGDPRALTEIESHLAKSDPVLAAKFAVFTVSPSRARQSMRESARQPAAPDPRQRQHRRAKRLAVLLTLACLLVMCTTLSVLSAS